MTPLQFAFVACNRNAGRFRDDPSFIYRCENMAAALRAGGHQVSLFHLTKFPLGKRFDAVVFHRPRQSVRFALTLLLLKRLKHCVLTADLDDLVFDEALAEFSPGVVNGLVSLTTARKNFLAHRKAMNRLDLLTVSTDPLEKHTRALFPAAQVVTIPNAVPLVWRKAVERVHQGKKELVVTYFPGTRSHDRDFSLIAEPLTAFLKKHSKTRLQVTGPLNFALQARPGQIIHREKVSFENYPHLFQDSWVNLAPLESTPFNQCKSALKVMEAGFWTIPTVCSPTSDTERFTGAGALQADKPRDWLQHLEALLDPGYYQVVSDKLRERTLKMADVHCFASRLVQTVLEARERK